MPSKPKDSISIPDLVGMVVAKLHGQDAIAELEKVSEGEQKGELKITYGKVTSFQDNKETIEQREEYVFRAGKKISTTEDGKRWNEAKKKIQDALLSEILKAHAMTKYGTEWAIGGDYWQDIGVFMVFETGNLENSDLTELADRHVYLGRVAAMDWLATLPGTGAHAPAEAEQDNPAPKKKREKGEPKTSTISGWKDAHDKIDDSRKILGNGCTIERAANHAAGDSDRDCFQDTQG